jgi:ATP/maltotriose-dependent transcriptional regulator MalT
MTRRGGSGPVRGEPSYDPIMDEAGDPSDSQPLERAREAVGRMQWEIAHNSFAAADSASDLEAADLEAWGTSAYMAGQVDTAVEAFSRVHTGRFQSGEYEDAVRAAHWVVFMLLGKGDVAQAGGWMKRQGRALERLPEDSPGHALPMLHQAYRLVALEHEYAAGRSIAEDAIEIARSGGDQDVEALALNVRGRSLIYEGRLEDGLAVLDETMVSVVSGELSPIVVGTVYCSLIEACEEVTELRRAHEWTDALHQWCQRQSGEVGFTAQCRIHRSEIFRGTGNLEQAEEEARRAHELFSRTPYQPATGHALYQLAEVQRLRGEFDEAEATFRQASACGIDPQPGLALLRLAQRDSETAASSLRRLAAEAIETPQRIRLLPALVDVMVAVDDMDAAAAAVRELAELAETFPMDALKARVAYARGVLALGRSEPELALDNLRRALATWQSLRTPFEVARTRLSIAQACRLLGDEETALLEQGAAGQILDDIGVARLPRLPPLASTTDHGLSAREAEVLRHLASGATNREIADEMHLSIRTVDRHVANILTKLWVTSRTAAVAHAYEHDLV